jgi:hypothetical protein
MRLTPYLIALAATGSIAAQSAPDFTKQVKPILEAACVHCHCADNDKGDLNMETKELMIKGGENGTALVPGDAAKSPIYTLAALAEARHHASAS